MNIYAYSLFSGSRGNSFLIGDGETNILIDAGVSAKRISDALRSVGVMPDSISAVFVTHEHSDHIKGLEMLAKKHAVPVYMTVGTARAAICDARSPVLPCLYAFSGNFTVKIGNFSVKSFTIPHDAAQPVGYIIENDGVKVGFSTDTGCISDEMTENLVGCRAAVIESNHDERLLMMGPYPYQLKLRIISDTGHLSNENAARLASMLCDGGARSILLAHLSEQNNSPDIALADVQSAVGDGVKIAVALPNDVVKLDII